MPEPAEPAAAARDRRIPRIETLPMPSSPQATATPPPAVPGRLSGRIALVTGASRGIGRAVALAFGREGAELIVVARTQGALEELDDALRAEGRHASLVVADLADGALIDRIGAALYARWGRLDILVGNAATLGVLSPLGHAEPAVFERVIAVNLVANWRLLRSCDPLLRASDAGRAIFVTSGVAPGRAYWGAYAASKAALETMVRTYAEETAKTAVRANLIDPGPTRTRMRATAFPGEDAQALKPADDARLMEAFIALALPACRRSGDIVQLD
jgi:NAD(P)-dependent dehydrogenase (short-subunit alcohol dehydrogenase family)